MKQILKNVPVGTKLYSPILGEVNFIRVEENKVYPIRVLSTNSNNFEEQVCFTKEGFYMDKYINAECVLFPSKEQRDWSKFEVPTTKKVKVTLHPFDKVLVRDNNECTWLGRLIMDVIDNAEYPFIVNSTCYKQCIPYTTETAHLINTNDTPSIEYKIEFSKTII